MGGAAWCSCFATALLPGRAIRSDMATVSTPEIYVEGDLFKRSRGLHPSRVKKKRVQKRFCQLTRDSFKYFKNRNEVRSVACYLNFVIAKVL